MFTCIAVFHSILFYRYSLFYFLLVKLSKHEPDQCDIGDIAALPQLDSIGLHIRDGADPTIDQHVLRHTSLSQRHPQVPYRNRYVDRSTILLYLLCMHYIQV